MKPDVKRRLNQSSEEAVQVDDEAAESSAD